MSEENVEVVGEDQGLREALERRDFDSFDAGPFSLKMPSDSARSPFPDAQLSRARRTARRL